MAFEATYSVQVGFTGATTGILVLGVSTIGGTDKFGTPLPGGFGGGYDTVTALTKQVRVTRGRDKKMDVMQQGKAVLTLHDKDGTYDPQNDASPLAGLLVPMRPVLVQATLFGITYPVFRGWTSEIDSDQALGVKETSITAVDTFTYLETLWPVIAATGPITVGDAIGLVLDDGSLTDPAFRDLDDGELLPNFAPDGSKNALEVIRDMLLVDQGAFFISAGGVATYRSRHWYSSRRTPDYTLFRNDVRYNLPGTSLDLVRNRARVTRTGGVMQTVEDATSRNLYGPRDVGDIESDYLRDDNQSLSLASHLVQTLKEPQVPIWNLQLDGVARSYALKAILATELGHHVRLSEIGRGYHVERMEETITALGGGQADHVATWALSPRPDVQPFQLGLSVLSGPDTLVY